MQTSARHDNVYPMQTRSNSLLKTLLEVNRQILQGVDYKVILEFLFDAVYLKIPFDRIGIALLEGTNGDQKMRLNWVKSKVPIHYLNNTYTSETVSERLLEIMNLNQPLINNDVLQYSIDHPQSKTSALLLRDGILSNLTCPLRFDGKSIGVIFFSSCQPYTYNEFHQKTALQIADEISLVVNYGQLQENTTVANRDRSQLHMTLHDLRSPLTTLQGFAHLSLEEDWYKKLDGDAQKVFQIFFRNTKYMSELVNDLSEVSLLENGEDKNWPEVVDVNAFCQDMFKMAQSVGDAKNIHFDLVITALPKEPACFDRHKISRVLNNLFSNAVKFSLRGSQIDFLVDAEPDRLTFSIRDHGLGIPESELPKLFKQFGKTCVRPTEGEYSSGQGLAIVKKLIDQVGGKIEVHSAPGEGSTFRFWIPVKADC